MGFSGRVPELLKFFHSACTNTCIEASLTMIYGFKSNLTSILANQMCCNADGFSDILVSVLCTSLTLRSKTYLLEGCCLISNCSTFFSVQNYLFYDEWNVKLYSVHTLYGTRSDICVCLSFGW